MPPVPNTPPPESQAATPDTPVSPSEPASYEAAVAELERLVQAMENEQLPLDQVMRSYQRGAELLAFCRSRLDAVEQQVKVLDDGQLKPWTAGRDAA